MDDSIYCYGCDGPRNALLFFNSGKEFDYD